MTITFCYTATDALENQVLNRKENATIKRNLFVLISIALLIALLATQVQTLMTNVDSSASQAIEIAPEVPKIEKVVVEEKVEKAEVIVVEEEVEESEAIVIDEKVEEVELESSPQNTSSASPYHSEPLPISGGGGMINLPK